MQQEPNPNAKCALKASLRSETDAKCPSEMQPMDSRLKMENGK